MVMMTFQTQLKIKETNPAKNQVWRWQHEWANNDEGFPGNSSDRFAPLATLADEHADLDAIVTQHIEAVTDTAA